MNSERILRVTNGYLQFCGYQLHKIDTKTHRYRLSVWGLANFILLVLCYGICFNHHFEHSSLLYVLQDVSPFLRRLVRLQLWLGLKTIIFHVYEMKRVVRSSNRLAELLPRVFAHKFSRAEGMAYILLFSTSFIVFCFALYVAFEMEFKLPPLDHILAALALFIPQFVLAGGLRCFLIGRWLLQQQLHSLTKDVLMLLNKSEPPNDVPTVSQSVNTGVVNVSFQLEPTLKRIFRQLELLANTQHSFTKALIRQLLLLVILNSNCLLAGVYGAIYFETTWYVMFSERSRRIFHVANLGIFVFIFWDYMCFCCTQVAFVRVKKLLYRKLLQVLKQRLRYNKPTRIVLKDMQELMRNEFDFKLCGGKPIGLWTFLMVQILIGFIIAFIIGYQYFNDQIIELNERLDGFYSGEK